LVCRKRCRKPERNITMTPPFMSQRTNASHLARFRLYRAPLTDGGLRARPQVVMKLPFAFVQYFCGNAYDIACDLSISPELRVELHSLRKVNLTAPVDRVGLAPHVGFPRVGTGLTTSAGLLLAAEGAADFCA